MSQTSGGPPSRGQEGSLLQGLRGLITEDFFNILTAGNAKIPLGQHWTVAQEMLKGNLGPNIPKSTCDRVR